jgi:hypothetical protein
MQFSTLNFGIFLTYWVDYGFTQSFTRSFAWRILCILQCIFLIPMLILLLLALLSSLSSPNHLLARLAQPKKTNSSPSLDAYTKTIAPRTKLRLRSREMI